MKPRIQVIVMTLMVLSFCDSSFYPSTPIAEAHVPHECPDSIPDEPILSGHLDQSDIVNRNLTFDRITKVGERLFTESLNRCDGHGRPAATGAGTPTSRKPDQPSMTRVSGPDSNSCAGCHAQPRLGGSGDFVANVFVLAQNLDPVTYSISNDFSDERNTLGMMGSGLIEALGREMTADLHAVRNAAIALSKAQGKDVTSPLVAKGVNFGTITAQPDGSLVTTDIHGVDTDLIIKPFFQKGVSRSLREFTVGASNHHSGMQAVERFGAHRTGTTDFDQDGVPDELSIGDITAMTLFQAALNMPGRLMPKEPGPAKSVDRGEHLFRDIGCAGCHRPSIILNSSDFCEPNPLNPPGIFNDTSQSYCFDMAKQGQKPRIEKGKDGKMIVRAFTDLKRHKICDETFSHFCNEKVVQGGVAVDTFITRKLWDVGNSASYGHRGDLTTIAEAILSHGGEGRSARDGFAALAASDRMDIIHFLKTLQVLPPGSRPVVFKERGSIN